MKVAASTKPPEEEVRFEFFVSTPQDMIQHPPLASSLQSFETCLFLVALGRFPAALVTCAGAWESVIKAKLGMKPETDKPLDWLIREGQSRFAGLRLFDSRKLDAFRRTRNRIVHYGFSPRDDEVCAAQLLETGFPFLDLCYQQMFGLELGGGRVQRGRITAEHPPGAESLMLGLDVYTAQQYRVAVSVYERAKDLPNIKPSRYFSALGHFIRYGLKRASMTASEFTLIEEADANLTKFELHLSERERIESLFKTVSWEFDCPICHEIDSLIGELDEDLLESKQISIRRCVCVNCGLMVPQGCPHLVDELVWESIEKEAPQIMESFGIR